MFSCSPLARAQARGGAAENQSIIGRIALSMRYTVRLTTVTFDNEAFDNIGTV